jgi:flagellar hook-associated protein 2
MSTVGLNFGSATSGAGFDVTTTVAAILANEDGIQTTEQTQLTALQAQDAVFTTLGTDLSTLTTNLQALTDATGAFATKEGSSSNTNILTLTSADTTAVAGTHNVTVSSLATTASNVSSEITNGADTLNGSLTINGTQVSVVSGTSDTLATFATAINTAAVGVTASVITDANGARLSLVSNTSGANGGIAITGNTLTDSTISTALGFPAGQAQAGANANLTVDGISVSSASNTVTGAIPGVTFQLLSSDVGTNVQIEVTNDNSAVESAVSSLVTSYNSVLKDISGQEGNDSNGNADPLFGNPTLSLLQTQLQSAIYGGKAVGNINSVTQLGIETQSDGTLTLNTSALDAALNSNYSNTAGFFQNPDSFGQNFATVLNGLGTQAPGGAVYLAQQQNSAQEKSINATLTTQKAASAAQSIALTTELNTANQELQAIPEQLSEINQIYSAITGYNQNNNG